MKKYILLALIIVLIAIAGCNRNKKPTIAFVAGAASDFWTITEAGCNKAAKELKGVDVVFKYTNNGATEEQKRILDDLLANGIAGVVIAPLDPLNQSQMIDLASAKIPVITTDSDIPGSKRLCYVGTGNIDAGRLEGKLIMEVLPAGGKIILFVGKADAQNAKERLQGIKDEIAGANIEIVAVKTDNLDMVRAKANVNDAIISNPDVTCFVGLWSYNGPAILHAVKESGKLDKIKIVCFDEEGETLDGVKKGEIYGTVVQQPFEFGYQSVRLLASYVSGNHASIPSTGQIIIPAKVLKQADADAYILKMKGLRSQ
jgi:ribose transport system substrate-binding protein